MGADHKYGRVTTERGNIGEDEPVVVFRAQDETLPKVLAYYAAFCLKDDSPRHHIDGVLDAREKVLAWQDNHATKVPSSDALATESQTEES